jgi:hypothetical protein
MRVSPLLLTLSSVILPFAACSAVNKRHQLLARDPTGDFSTLYDASNYQNGSTAPGTTSSDASGQTVVVGGTGADDDSQRPGCTTIFINTADVSGSQTSGWEETPELVGFQIDRNLTYGDITMPFYVETGKNLSAVKRVIMTQPGDPRDTWKYVNLFRNSLLCAVANTSMAVEFDDVLVTAPIWLGASDIEAGAGQSSDLYFGDSSWATGSLSQGPSNTTISTFKVMDDAITRFANITEYPSVTSVSRALGGGAQMSEIGGAREREWPPDFPLVMFHPQIMVVGHSLGGSFSQRYAFARKEDDATEALVS